LVGKEGHAWLSLRNKDHSKDFISVGLKDLLSISRGWSDDKQKSTLYLDEIKSTKVDIWNKLFDFIEWVDEKPKNVSKSKIKKVADELGIEADYLYKQIKEINYFK
jgi:DNA-binding NtrC family response regulator